MNQLTTEEESESGDNFLRQIVLIILAVSALSAISGVAQHLLGL